MPNDRDDKGRFRVLPSLYEMLGLTSDAFVGAMKEAVWVPGGVDQLSDIIIRAFGQNELARIIQELPDIPEVMALIGRILIALNDYPERETLGQEVIARARQAGPAAIRYLSPYSWYPPVEEIREFLVSPYRLHAASLMMRMRWGGTFEGIEAVWVLRFAAGSSGEAYFVTDGAEQQAFDEMQWQPITMEDALGLITLVGLVQSAVNNQFPFDGMTGVGLWMVLAGGREVRPWIDASYALETEPLSAENAARAYVNALNNGDYAAAYDLLAPDARPDDILDYIEQESADMPAAGDLWRLDAETRVPADHRPTLVAEAWYWTDDQLWERQTEMEMVRDADQHWRIARIDVKSERALDESSVERYLGQYPRYYAILPIQDIEDLVDLLPAPPTRGGEGVVHFSDGPEFDYREPFDMGASRDVDWTIILGEPGYVMIFARDELLLRRELTRLQDDEAVGDVARTGVVDLLTEDRIQRAAEDGPDALKGLLDRLDRQ